MPAVVKIEYRSPKQAAVKDKYVTCDKMTVTAHHKRSLSPHSLFFIGKGITYDTGGADVKTGGHMRGMSRDKGGAGGVSGFMKTVSLLQPEHVNVTAYLAFVRNSIGSNAYVSDEIIVSRAGVRGMLSLLQRGGAWYMAHPDLSYHPAFVLRHFSLSSSSSSSSSPSPCSPCWQHGCRGTDGDG